MGKKGRSNLNLEYQPVVTFFFFAPIYLKYHLKWQIERSLAKINFADQKQLQPRHFEGFLLCWNLITLSPTRIGQKTCTRGHVRGRKQDNYPDAWNIQFCVTDCQWWCKLFFRYIYWGLSPGDFGGFSQIFGPLKPLAMELVAFELASGSFQSSSCAQSFLPFLLSKIDHCCLDS